MSAKDDFIADWDNLLAAMKAHEAELAMFGPYTVALEETLEEIRISRARQINFKSRHQQATQDLRAQVTAGRELVLRLRSLIWGHFGPHDERLEVFGISVRRRKVRPKVETGKRKTPPDTTRKAASPQ